MDANIAGSLISSVGSIATSALRNKYDREQNEKNRQWQEKMANQSNQWSIQQWNRNNLYNSPVEQMKRLREAGLNPDLMYGGSGSLVSAQSPNVTPVSSSGPPSSAGLGQMGSSIGSLASSILQNQLLKSQEENVNADTEKKRGETNLLTIDSFTRDALNKGQIDLNSVNVSVGKTAAQLNNTQRGVLVAEINNLNAATDKVQQESANLVKQNEQIDVNILSQKFQMYMASKQYDMLAAQTLANIRKIDASIKVDEATVKEVLGMLTYRMQNLVADTNEKQASTHVKIEQAANEFLKAIGLDINNQQAQLNLEMDSKFIKKERRTQIATAIMNSVSNVFQGISSIVGTVTRGKGSK
ncbi:MAG: DNA pilot protein [Microviridae sp.]|nr:MAG: DNA pilot protein [Microviridae sp.]UCS96061.1 MAG: minor capsid protein [Microviridae sp.]